MLADIAGKAFHKVCRQRVLPFFEFCPFSRRRPGLHKWAAFPHRGTNFGSLAVRCLAGKSRGLSYALAFVDISAAFYILKRRFLMPDELTLSPEGQTLCHNALARIGCSAQAAAAVAAAKQAAWFTLQYDDEIAACAKGALPGIRRRMFTIVSSRRDSHTVVGGRLGGASRCRYPCAGLCGTH